MTFYIVDWDKNFEIAESRRHKKNKWVALPNKMDSLGYKRLVKEKNKHEIFSAWILLVQIASKMPERGVFEDDTGPLNFEDFELMTGFPSKTFEKAIEFLESPKIQWIGRLGHAQQNAGHTTSTLHNITVHNSTIQDNTKYICDMENHFQKFWKLYPERNGKKVGKSNTLNKFKKLKKEDLEGVLRAAANYQIYAGDFPKDPERFLKDGFWKDFDYPPKELKDFEEKDFFVKGEWKSEWHKKNHKKWEELKFGK